jgi:hypothetical protein
MEFFLFNEVLEITYQKSWLYSFLSWIDYLQFLDKLYQNQSCCRRQITKFHHDLILRERDLAVSPQIFLTKILPFYVHDPVCTMLVFIEITDSLACFH